MFNVVNEGSFCVKEGIINYHAPSNTWHQGFPSWRTRISLSEDMMLNIKTDIYSFGKWFTVISMLYKGESTGMTWYDLDLGESAFQRAVDDTLRWVIKTTKEEAKATVDVLDAAFLEATIKGALFGNLKSFAECWYFDQERTEQDVAIIKSRRGDKDVSSLKVDSELARLRERRDALDAALKYISQIETALDSNQ